MRLSRKGTIPLVVNDNGNALPFMKKNGQVKIDATSEQVAGFISNLKGIELYDHIEGVDGIVMFITDTLACEKKRPPWQRLAYFIPDLDD